MSTSTIVRHSDLPSMIQILQDARAEQLDVIAGPDAFRIDPATGELVIDIPAQITATGVTAPRTERFQVADTFYRGIADRLKIPTGYLRRMIDIGNHEMVAANINGWAAHLRKPWLFRCYTGTSPVARAFLSHKYGGFDNLEGAFAIMKGLKDGGIDISKIKVTGDLSETSMFINVSAPELALLAPEFLRGYRNPFGRGGQSTGDEPPVMFAGFQFRNSEIGFGAWEIVPRITVKVCNNGMIVPLGQFRRVHLGSAQEEGVVNWSAETRRLGMDLVTSQTADAVKTFLSTDYVQKVIDAVTEKASVQMPETHTPAVVVQIVTKPLSLTDAEQNDLLNLFCRGGQMDTVGGVVQAVTALAQNVPNPDRAAELEESVMKVLDLRELVTA